MKTGLRILSVVVAWTLTFSQLMPSAFALHEGLINTTPTDPTRGGIGWDVLKQAGWADPTVTFSDEDFSTPYIRQVTLNYLLDPDPRKRHYFIVTEYLDYLYQYANRYGVSLADARKQAGRKLVIYLDDVYNIHSEEEAQALIARASALVQKAIAQHYQHTPIPPLDEIASAFTWGTAEQITAQLAHLSTPAATTEGSSGLGAGGSGQEPGTEPDAVIGSEHGGLMSRAEHEKQFNEKIAPVLKLIGEELGLPPALDVADKQWFDFRTVVQKTGEPFHSATAGSWYRLKTDHGELRVEPGGLLIIQDTRFPFGHAGRNEFAVYGPDLPTLAHEVAELYAWADFAVVFGLVNRRQIRQQYKLGTRIQNWLAKRSEFYVNEMHVRVADMEAYFHLLGLMAELQARQTKAWPAISRSAQGIDWNRIYTFFERDTKRDTHYRIWLHDSVQPAITMALKEWSGVEKEEDTARRDKVIAWLQAWQKDLEQPERVRERAHTLPESPDHAIASSGPAAGQEGDIVDRQDLSWLTPETLTPEIVLRLLYARFRHFEFVTENMLIEELMDPTFIQSIAGVKRVRKGVPSTSMDVTEAVGHDLRTDDQLKRILLILVQMKAVSPGYRLTEPIRKLTPSQFEEYALNLSHAIETAIETSPRPDIASLLIVPTTPDHITDQLRTPGNTAIMREWRERKELDHIETVLTLSEQLLPQFQDSGPSLTAIVNYTVAHQAALRAKETVPPLQLGQQVPEAILQVTRIARAVEDALGLPLDSIQLKFGEGEPTPPGGHLQAMATPKELGQGGGVVETKLPPVEWIGDVPENLRGLQIGTRVELSEGANPATAMAAALKWHAPAAAATAGPGGKEPASIFKRPDVQVSPDWTLITILADQKPVATETAAVLASIAEVIKQL